MDDPQLESNITTVTYPDYILGRTAYRILVLGHDRMITQFEEAFSKFWPNEDLTLYLRPTELDYRYATGEQIEWAVYQAAVSDTIILQLAQDTPAWAMAILIDFPGKILYVAEDSFTMIESALARKRGTNIHRTALAAVIALASSRA